MIRLLAIFLGALALLPAQTSSLTGTVTDDQGAAVPETAVTVTNLDTSASRMSLSDPTGAFRFPQMPPGRYQVEAQKPGFRTFLQQVQLQINTPGHVSGEVRDRPGE
ncbi:MAG: carboxypeptidase regulatory-like domain-containing protein [Bryobacterales bacterium]|nr:carboxypeptidase regulatory-like domain-containing protein [Bryobacterales bacterium]